jgi:hypothetical protein
MYKSFKGPSVDYLEGISEHSCLFHLLILFLC